MFFSLFSDRGGNNSSVPDFAFIDEYLSTWDRFAQGASELVPDLKRDKPRFEQQLAQALIKGDKRAPSRVVFYTVVQVSSFITYDKNLGRACANLVGSDVSIHTSKNGERSYFAGDLYFWWQRHQSEFETFFLFEEWRQRDFAKKTVIPMYESVTKKE